MNLTVWTLLLKTEINEVLHVSDIEYVRPTHVCINISSSPCLSIIQLQLHTIANLDKPIPTLSKNIQSFSKNTDIVNLYLREELATFFSYSEFFLLFISDF